MNKTIVSILLSSSIFISTSIFARRVPKDHIVSECAPLVNGLFGFGVNSNIQNGFRWPALFQAVLRGQTEVVTSLLEVDIDPNEQSITGWTVLHLAVFMGHIEIVIVLLDYGADPYLENNSYQIAMDLAEDDDILAILSDHMTYFKY